MDQVAHLRQMHAEMMQAKLQTEAAEREKQLQGLMKEAAHAAITETVQPIIEAEVQKIAAPLFTKWYREMREKERKDKKKKKKRKRERGRSSSSASESEEAEATDAEDSVSESSSAEEKKVKKKEQRAKKESEQKKQSEQRDKRQRGRPRKLSTNKK